MTDTSRTPQTGGEQMECFGSRVIRDHMPEQHRELYRQLPFVLVGHGDKDLWPWASNLFNNPGFMTSNDATTLDIDALPVFRGALAAGKLIRLAIDHRSIFKPVSSRRSTPPPCQRPGLRIFT